MGEFVGIDVGVLDGEYVGILVGEFVGIDVGVIDGEYVGILVGEFVGLDVGEDSPTAASSSSHRSDKIIIDISSRFGTRKFVKFMARYRYHYSFSGENERKEHGRYYFTV